MAAVTVAVRYFGFFTVDLLMAVRVPFDPESVLCSPCVEAREKIVLCEMAYTEGWKAQ